MAGIGAIGLDWNGHAVLVSSLLFTGAIFTAKSFLEFKYIVFLQRDAKRLDRKIATICYNREKLRNDKKTGLVSATKLRK